MEKRALYKWEIDLGDTGNLSGLFICDETLLKKAYEDDLFLHFGDVLGKGSNVGCFMRDISMMVLTDKEEDLKKVEEIFGSNHVSGMYLPNFIKFARLSLEKENK